MRVGVGPFAMAFDPFSLEDVAKHAPVPIDERDKTLGLRRYRFAYLASVWQVRTAASNASAPPSPSVNLPLDVLDVTKMR